VAVVWRASRGPNECERYAPVCDALRTVAIEPVPVAYDEAGTQLADVDGVLVWIDPLRDGKTRREIDVRLYICAPAMSLSLRDRSNREARSTTRPCARSADRHR
jgi:hypothetical protein